MNDDLTHAAAPALAPSTPVFAREGTNTHTDEMTPSSWEDHPDWPDASAWAQPLPPHPAALVLPASFDESLTPSDAQGRYVPHLRDEAGVVHFFAVIPRPADSPLPEEVPHELRYFRVRAADDDLLVHDSLPVMPVREAIPSPWPLPALNLQLEDGDLDAAHTLARAAAHTHGLSFPDPLPPLALPAPQVEPDAGWYHFDTALVTAEPQGVDDGYSVGAVDVYANHDTGQWAARYLPLGDFDTLDEALAYQDETLHSRVMEDRASALAVDGFNRSPALYERIARAEADATLTDLLEQHYCHYPPDYDGDFAPEWEPLTSKEWDAYRDHLRTVTESVPAMQGIIAHLPTATPLFAGGGLVAASQQPEAPYRMPEAMQPDAAAPAWQLVVVPAQDPEGTPLGYSAVCVDESSDLANKLVRDDATPHARWLEVAQFQTEARANQFREDFLSLAGKDDLSDVAGPALACVIAEDLGLDGHWQVMDKQGLEQFKSGEWCVTNPTETWLHRLNEVSNPRSEAAILDLDP